MNFIDINDIALSNISFKMLFIYHRSLIYYPGLPGILSGVVGLSLCCSYAVTINASVLGG